MTSSIAVTRLQSKAVLASVEAQAAAKRVAGDADARSRAVQGGEAQLGCPGHHVAQGASSSGAASSAVDLSAIKATGAY